MQNMSDEELMRAAYNALVENCCYQQYSDAWEEGIRVLKLLGERLDIEPSADVAHVLDDD